MYSPIWILFICLLIFVSVCLLIYIKTDFKQNVEHYIEVEVSENEENPYPVKEEHNDIQKCNGTRVRPNDIIFTNVIQYHLDHSFKDAKFYGASVGKCIYFVITKNTSPIKTIIDTQIKTVYYDDECSRYMYEQIKHKIFPNAEKNIIFSHISEERQLNKVCNSFDISNNIFMKYAEKQDFYESVMIVGLNTVYESNFIEYFKNTLNKSRFKVLSILEDNPSSKMLEDMAFKIRVHLFNSSVRNNFFDDEINAVIAMDDILCSIVDEPDIVRLINTISIDFKNTQFYVELFNCNIPPQIEEQLQSVFDPKQDVPTDNIFVQGETCSHVSIKNNEHSSVNRYVNQRCDAINNFIDIVYPFKYDYEFQMDPTDLNVLKILGSTFDDIVPILNVVSKNNLSIPRYKINVDPSKYPTDKYIDDIYYGTDEEDNTTFSLLTNSIPFEFDPLLHNVSIIKNEETNEIIEILIHNIKPTDILNNFITVSKNTLVNLPFLENDRIYMVPKSITDSNLEIILNERRFLNNENFFHGYITKTNKLNDFYQNKYNEYVRENNIPEDKIEKLETGDIFVIKLFNIRYDKNENKANIDITKGGACFDKNWTQIMDNKILTKQLCESTKGNKWDIRCKYNYECPFFKKNKNYLNSFGGCSDNGFCQMPVGIENRGFTKYEEDPKKSFAMCYNCEKKDPADKNMNCCKEQSSNPELFNDKLKSADYMFDNDTVTRISKLYIESEESCENKSLKINKYT